MFENIAISVHRKRLRANRKSSQVISKHKELKVLERIYKSATKLQQRKLRQPRIRKAVEKLIHEEIAIKGNVPVDDYEEWHEPRLLRRPAEEYKKETRRRKKVLDTTNLDYKVVQFLLKQRLGRGSIDFEPDFSVYGEGEQDDRIEYEDKNESEGENDENYYNSNGFHDRDSNNHNDEQLENDDDDDDIDDDLDEHDEAYEEYDIVASHKLDQFTNAVDGRGGEARKNFLIESQGLEIIPSPSEIKSEVTKHITNLNTLLHLNILRRNWKMAYKIFCILVRFPQVDVRQIWPLGVEVLIQLSKVEESQHKQHKVGTTFDKKARKFFEYMNNFYSVAKQGSASYNNTDRPDLAPVYRGGTIKVTPLYLICSLWHLFVRREYEHVQREIQDLILVPPYSSEGALYYILALCRVCQCEEIVTHFAMQSDFAKFIELETTYRTYSDCKQLLELKNEMIMKDLENCQKYNFLVPRKEIKEQLSEIREKLEIIYNEQNAEKSDYNHASGLSEDIEGQGEEEEEIGGGGEEGEEEEEEEAGAAQADWSVVLDDDDDDDDESQNNKVQNEVANDDYLHSDLEFNNWDVVNDKYERASIRNVEGMNNGHEFQTWKDPAATDGKLSQAPLLTSTQIQNHVEGALQQDDTRVINNDIVPTQIDKDEFDNQDSDDANYLINSLVNGNSAQFSNTAPIVNGGMEADIASDNEWNEIESDLDEFDNNRDEGSDQNYDEDSDHHHDDLDDYQQSMKQVDNSIMEEDLVGDDVDDLDFNDEWAQIEDTEVALD